jgi:heat shock protein HslJ
VVVVAGGMLSLLVLLAPIMQATPTPGAAGIPPVVWELVALTGADGVPVEIDDPSRYTLQFLEEGKVAARFDCNRGSGGFTAADGELTIGQMATTLALCEPDSQAQPFQLILQDVTSYELDADGYLILRGDGGELRLSPQLTGVLWSWREFAGGDGEIVRPDDPERYTVEFLADGKLAIRADCNRGMGAYTVDAPRIDLRVGGLTRMACPPGSHMDRFVRYLDEVNSHVFRDGNLYLALPIDSGILEFVPRTIEAPEATPVAG